MSIEKAALEQMKKRIPSKKPTPGEKAELNSVGETAKIAEQAAKDKFVVKMLNKFVERADDTDKLEGKATNAVRAVWDKLPARLQRGLIDPRTRGAIHVTVGAWTGLSPVVEGFDTLVKLGLLDLKKGAIANQKEIEEMINDERVMNKYVGEIGALVTAGEGKPIFDLIEKAKEAGRDLTSGARKHLEEVRQRRASKESVRKLSEVEKAEQLDKLSKTRADIAGSKASRSKGGSV